MPAGRPEGSGNILPTKKDQNKLIEQLTKKAADGDTLATGLLLILCELKKPY